jgi:hypothetical protein
MTLNEPASASALRELWVRFPLPSTRNVVLVLESSAGRQQHREAIAAFARGVLRELPFGIQASLYFLGNSQEYPVANVDSELPLWFRANEHRASLVAPLLPALARQCGALVVVLASGPIFDLDDWLEEPVLGEARFVRFGDVPLSGDSRCRQESVAAVQPRQLTADWDLPRTGVELSGRAVMPFFWDNDAYEWHSERRCLLARAAADYAVCVGVLCLDPADLVVVETLAGGQARPLAWQECVRSADDTWQALTPAEETVVRQCLRGERFDCPICQGSHGKEVLRCLASALRSAHNTIMGDPVYPSLDDQPHRGLCLLREAGTRIWLCRCCCAAVKVPPDSVVVRTGRRTAVLYRFDTTAADWQPGGAVQAYHPLGGDTYLLVL